MCELFALSASEPVDIKLSLVELELARHDGLTGLHADGWGVAFLQGRDAQVFREPVAAARSPWSLGEQPVRSSTVVARIRHATRGVIKIANTQPFVRELAGAAIVFAHNGHLGELTSAGDRFRPIGETDPEMAFCQLLERQGTFCDPQVQGPASRSSEMQPTSFCSRACR